ncbi:Fungal-trans domain-containing protein [Fusarium sp. LHS14.1]|nr:Fungal-trans domain-containing protein [Fusarium sp. LHS14.1]
MSGPEEQDMAAMQAHITRPKTLSLLEQSRLKATVDSLPPKSVADFLLSVCIKHGVDIFFYFDQAQVIDELVQFYSNPTSPLRSDPSFICLLLGIFALGSHWTPLERPSTSPQTLQSEECDSGHVFFRQAKLLIPDIIERSCLRSIQACFLLGVYLMPLSAVGSSYIYMGLALRKALAFDLHQSSDDQILDEREREIRRRLWWSIYSLERCTTIKLNRPRSVDAGIIKTPLPVPLPSLDKAQKFDNIQLQIAYARLITILDRATDSETRSTEATKPAEPANMEAELREWKKSLPEDFEVENINPRDSRYRAVFHLYLNYYYAWIAIGKVSLITAVRATLQHHLGQESQPLRIDGTIERLSKSCTKAARKLLQLFEDLTRIRNTARFSFTDFQGCSIATIVTLIAGIIERDSTYESRVTFGLNCLRDMAAGNLTAKVGVRFVETLQAISNEAAHKLRQSGTFSGQLEEDIESLQPSAYNDWAAWLASQHQPQTNIFDSTVEQGTATGPEITRRERSAPNADLCNLQTTDEDAGWSGQVLEPLSTTRLLMQQPTEVPEPLVVAENDFTSTIYGDDQSFLIGLTGLDVLDFAGYSTQLD